MKKFQVVCLKCGSENVRIFVESRIDFSRKSGNKLSLSLFCERCANTETEE